MIDATLDALGSGTRRRVLRCLVAGERSVGDVVAQLRATAPISQPAVSQHLGVLHTAGLVTVRADGRHRLYRLDPVGVDRVMSWVASLVEDPLAPMAQPLDALATEVARGRRSRRGAGTQSSNTRTPDARGA